jgi:hypothetical protein
MLLVVVGETQEHVAGVCWTITPTGHLVQVFLGNLGEIDEHLPPGGADVIENTL